MFKCNPNDTYSCLIYDNTTTVKTIVTNKSPLLSYETKIIFEYIIHISLFYVTSIFGITVNIINIIVYKKQGLKDSITLGFFALSISDLFVAGLPIETATCYALKFLLPDSNIAFTSVHYVNSSWSKRLAYSISCTITAFLSIERCLCVILPLKVKVIFTKSRTAAIITSTVLLHIIAFVPIFVTHQLRWQKTPSRNNSEVLRVWFGPHRDVIEDFNAISTSIALPTVDQIIVTCCVGVMIHGLRQSSKFRHAVSFRRTGSSTQRSVNTTTTTDSSIVDLSINATATYVKTHLSRPGTLIRASVQETSFSNHNNQRQRSQINTLTQRDARLVRTMVFVVAILSACNIPNLVMIYAILAVPELNIHRAYHNTYSLIFSINYVIATMNASLNFFVYYNTSTRYREVFDQVFRRAKG